MQATNGPFDAPSENVYADIPLTTIAALSNGSHTIYVHGRDAAGNWGATATTPWSSTRQRRRSAARPLGRDDRFGAANMTLNVTAAEVGTGIAGGQYWIDGTATPPANPTAFSGTSATINTSALPAGVHTVYVRVRDGATNWSAVSSVALTVIQAVADASSTTSVTTTATTTRQITPCSRSRSVREPAS